jgi:hypothetical protein
MQRNTHQASRTKPHLGSNSKKNESTDTFLPDTVSRNTKATLFIPAKEVIFIHTKTMNLVKLAKNLQNLIRGPQIIPSFNVMINSGVKKKVLR